MADFPYFTPSLPPSLPRKVDATAQLVVRLTPKPFQARVFLPNSIFGADSLIVFVDSPLTPPPPSTQHPPSRVQSHASTSVRTLKFPSPLWQPWHCLDSRKSVLQTLVGMGRAAHAAAVVLPWYGDSQGTNEVFFKKRKNNLDKTPVITGFRVDPRIKISKLITLLIRVQELCESRGGRTRTDRSNIHR